VSVTFTEPSNLRIVENGVFDDVSGSCDEAAWPDSPEVGCEECKARVAPSAGFGNTYGGLCDNYCQALGLSCIGAWNLESSSTAPGICDPNDDFWSSDARPGSSESCSRRIREGRIDSRAICECSTESPFPPGWNFEYCGNITIPQSETGFSITCNGAVVYEPHTGTGTTCADVGDDGVLVVPEGVTTLDPDRDCPNLRSVVLPTSIEVIDACSIIGRNNGNPQIYHPPTSHCYNSQASWLLENYRGNLVSVEHCGNATIPQSEVGFPVTCNGAVVYAPNSGTGTTCLDVTLDYRVMVATDDGSIPDTFPHDPRYLPGTDQNIYLDSQYGAPGFGGILVVPEGETTIRSQQFAPESGCVRGYNPTNGDATGYGQCVDPLSHSWDCGVDAGKFLMLRSVVLPGSVESIEPEAFGWTNSKVELDSFVLSRRFSVGEVGYTCRHGCKGRCTCQSRYTGELEIDGPMWLVNVTITEPSSLQSVGDRAFKNAGITSLVVPASVDTWGVDVFSGCQLLTTVEYCGSATIPQSDTGFSVTCNGAFVYEAHTGTGTTCADAANGFLAVPASYAGPFDFSLCAPAERIVDWSGHPPSWSGLVEKPPGWWAPLRSPDLDPRTLLATEYCGTATIGYSDWLTVSCEGQHISGPRSGAGTTCRDVGLDGRLVIPAGHTSIYNPSWDIEEGGWGGGWGWDGGPFMLDACLDLITLVVPDSVVFFGPEFASGCPQVLRGRESSDFPIADLQAAQACLQDVRNGLYGLQTVEYCGTATIPQSNAGFSITCNGTSVYQARTGTGTNCADVGLDGGLVIPEGETSTRGATRMPNEHEQYDWMDPSISDLGDGSLSGCSSFLRDVTFPASLETIEWHTFGSRRCTGNCGDVESSENWQRWSDAGLPSALETITFNQPPALRLVNDGWIIPHDKTALTTIEYCGGNASLSGSLAHIVLRPSYGDRRAVTATASVTCNGACVGTATATRGVCAPAPEPEPEPEPEPVVCAAACVADDTACDDACVADTPCIGAMQADYGGDARLLFAAIIASGDVGAAWAFCHSDSNSDTDTTEPAAGTSAPGSGTTNPSTPAVVTVAATATFDEGALDIGALTVGEELPLEGSAVFDADTVTAFIADFAAAVAAGIADANPADVTVTSITKGSVVVAYTVQSSSLTEEALATSMLATPLAVGGYTATVATGTPAAQTPAGTSTPATDTTLAATPVAPAPAPVSSGATAASVLLVAALVTTAAMLA
jgi:hypothetical protein